MRINHHESYFCVTLKDLSEMPTSMNYGWFYMTKKSRRQNTRIRYWIILILNAFSKKVFSGVPDGSGAKPVPTFGLTTCRDTQR